MVKREVPCDLSRSLYLFIFYTSPSSGNSSFICWPRLVPFEAELKILIESHLDFPEQRLPERGNAKTDVKMYI